MFNDLPHLPGLVITNALDGLTNTLAMSNDLSQKSCPDVLNPLKQLLLTGISDLPYFSDPDNKLCKSKINHIRLI